MVNGIVVMNATDLDIISTNFNMEDVNLCITLDNQPYMQKNKNWRHNYSLDNKYTQFLRK